MYSPKVPRSSFRNSWMFSDPYTYQYSDLEDGYGYNQGSALYELPGSTPAPRYELPANVPVELLVPPSAEPIHTACKLARQRSANPRARARRALSHQPASAGLIPVVEDMPMTTSAVGPRTSSQPAYSDGLIVAYADGIIPVSGSNGFIPVSCGSDGLIPAFGTEGLIPVPTPTPSPDHGLMTIDETTPNTPSCDFDSILRNIEPVGKAGRRKIRRERSSRYYDRYSSNFG
ncbi:hypothetical protein GGS20DRAFT_547820 [Poronia punctata]|nr:hypothetical protein GGS20DRAFT_547820 [Poronia punctata]